MKAFAFRNNKKVESQSSSGGAFTAIVQAFFANAQSGGDCPKTQNSLSDSTTCCVPEEVDSLHVVSEEAEMRVFGQSGGGGTANAIVFGAAFDENLNVVHCSADSVDACSKFRGSKYVASDLTAVFPELETALNSGKYILFSGTPCQVNAIRAYIKNHKLPNDRFYAVDIICHGTPNQKMWRDYVGWLEEENNSKLKAFSFRYKGAKWKLYPCMALFQNGKSKVNTQDVRAFTGLFFTHLAFRECCYSCKFANMNRVGDITIGDFWGFEAVMSDTQKKWDVKAEDGVNLVLVNNARGQVLVDSILATAEEFEYLIAECQSNDYVKFQSNLNAPVERTDDVDVFREEYKKFGIGYLINKYCDYTPMGKIIFHIKKFAHDTGLISLLKR